MPRSEEKNASKNIERLSHEEPYASMPPKQRVAIGMSEARRAGGDVKPKKHKGGHKSAFRARALKADNGEA